MFHTRWKTFWGEKIFCCKTNFMIKNKIWVEKNFKVKKHFWGEKKFLRWIKIFEVKKIFWGEKKFCGEKVFEVNIKYYSFPDVWWQNNSFTTRYYEIVLKCTNLYGKFRGTFTFSLITFEPLDRFCSFSIPNFSQRCLSKNKHSCLRIRAVIAISTDRQTDRQTERQTDGHR